MPQRNISQTLALCLGVFVLSFLIGLAVLAWTEPGAAPPGGNVSAPINVSNTAQRKTGALRVGGFISDSATNLATLSGNVGIGTTAPETKLHIYNPNPVTISFPDDILTFSRAGVINKTVFKYKNGDFPLTISSGGKDILTLKGSGNVGIGTTEPGTKLEVAGQIKVAGVAVAGASDEILTFSRAGVAMKTVFKYKSGEYPLTISSVGGTPYTEKDILTLRGSGNVGIGTTEPTSKLQVSGGYIQIPTITGIPRPEDCNGATAAGRMVVRTDGTAATTLYVCNGISWQAK